MQIGNVTPQTFHDFTAGLTSAQQSRRNLYFLSAQQLVSHKEQSTKNFFQSRLRSSSTRAREATAPLISYAKDNVFSSRRVASGDSAVVSGSAPDNASGASFKFTVDQLAASQDVVSNRLDADEKNPLGRGIFSFAINRNNDVTRVSVQVDQLDTNEDVLNKVADAVNDSGTGLRATVQKQYTAGTVQLKVSGVLTQDMTSVTLTDKSCNLLSGLGVSTSRYATGANGGISQANDDAVFSLNGMSFVSDSNRIAIYDNTLSHPIRNTSAFPRSAQEIYQEYTDNDYSFPNQISSSDRGARGLFHEHVASIDLKGAGENVSANVVRDTSAVAEQITSFVQETADLVDTLRQKPSYGFIQTVDFISGQFDRAARELSDYGIEKDQESNTYEVTNRDKLLDRLNSEFNASKLFFGGAGGLAGKTMFGIQKSIYAPLTGMSRVETTETSLLDTSGFIVDLSV